MKIKNKLDYVTKKQFFFRCILMLRYAWMLGDSNMINVNIFGLLTNMIYMIFYYHYTSNTVLSLIIIKIYLIYN